MNKPETKVVEQSKATGSAMSSDTPASSPEGVSVSPTPKDVSPYEAAAWDVIERKIQSDNPDERQEALLDEAIELTFPASDPISVPVYGKAEEKSKAPHVLDEHETRIVVPNTRPDAPRVTLFGQLNDGSYTAKVMDEDAVPYTYCWDNAIDQAMVYIEPDDEQLERMITALNEGRLEFSRLQDFGTANGGTSTITVS
ncbi:MAG TPA: hypothetical protein VIF82_07955 [Burkholderiaceae bacterium]